MQSYKRLKLELVARIGLPQPSAQRPSVITSQLIDAREGRARAVGALSGGRRPYSRCALVVGGGLSPPSPSSRSYLVPPRASRRPRFLCHCYERWRRRFTRNSGARHKTGAVHDPKRTAPRQRDGQARATHAASLERAAAASIAPSSRSYFVVLCGALKVKKSKDGHCKLDRTRRAPPPSARHTAATPRECRWTKCH